MSHTCHAPGCSKPVPPKMFACRAHWFSLPKDIQDAIWREYRPGQEVSKTPTVRYLAVQRLACSQLAFKPYNEKAAYECAQLLYEAVQFQQQAIKAGHGDPLKGLVPDV